MISYQIQNMLNMKKIKCGLIKYKNINWKCGYAYTSHQPKHIPNCNYRTDWFLLLDTLTRKCGTVDQGLPYTWSVSTAFEELLADQRCLVKDQTPPTLLACRLMWQHLLKKEAWHWAQKLIHGGMVFSFLLSMSFVVVVVTAPSVVEGSPITSIEYLFVLS